MKKKQLVSLLLVSAMALSLCACGSGKKDSENSQGTQNGDAALDLTGLEGDALNDAVYNYVLGDFYEAYQKAQDASTVSERYALEAIAEAKLLESGTFLPLQSNGGRYAMSRVAPYTVDYSLWGTDEYRFHQALVTTEFIKAADRTEMKAKWNELKGTGEYEAWAKQYLTDKGYTLKDEYTLAYTSDPQTWDALATYRAADSEAIVNTYDGLMEYDVEGNQQYALATDMEVSDDGLEYTFTIRDDATWVDAQGKKVADVTAEDFVYGMQHLLDSQGGLEGLLFGIIKNAQEYVYGEVTDFAEVGVKADGNKVTYTLEAPCPYFTTMVGYNMFVPLCKDYFLAQGGAFGVSEFNAVKDTCTFGTDPEHIVYCGPYLVSSYVASNSVTFEANPTYYNKDNINIKKISWKYNDGSDELKAYNDAKAGTIDVCGLTSAPLEQAKADNLFDDYAYVSGTDATSFSAFMNVYRQAWANMNDDTQLVSTQTDDQKKATQAAMLNVHFRRAVTYAVDRGAYNASMAGDELKEKSLINSYTPGNFVQLTEDVTVAINGTDTKFEKGTYYGQIVQAQLEADGSSIIAWSDDADEGNGGSSGFDGWYNPEAAVAELAIAIDELAKEGVTVSADSPIVLDLPYYSASTVYTNRAQAFKQSVEKSLEGKVVINLCATEDVYAWYYAGYYADYGSQANYNIYDCSGWGPDYGDPCSYLNTMLPYDGDMIHVLGVY